MASHRTRQHTVPRSPSREKFFKHALCSNRLHTQKLYKTLNIQNKNTNQTFTNNGWFIFKQCFGIHIIYCLLKVKGSFHSNEMDVLV